MTQGWLLPAAERQWRNTATAARKIMIGQYMSRRRKPDREVMLEY
jgi:hypothetical protein